MSQKRKIVFVADFFRNDLLGGAECNDAVLISHLESRGHKVQRVLAREVSETMLASNASLFIVSNFVTLSEEAKYKMANGRVDYVIYEHDHKYVKTRDPSKFKDFKAPEDQIVNREFYEKAKAVVVLSEVCKGVIELNLGLTNVHSIGCSLWSETRLELIESLAKTEKTVKHAVVNSSNRIKGTTEATNWCKSQNIEPEMIFSSVEEDFLKELAGAEKLVFFPQVLETFSRLACEAKMLNCKLITKPKLLGFASEYCFSMSGHELIDDIRQRVYDALELFEQLIESDWTELPGELGEVTAILTCYKRPQLLKEQIKALREQAVPPKEIWVWGNAPGWNIDMVTQDLRSCGADKIFDCDHNWKFYGRFAAAMLVDTEYVAIFDDDTIPGKDWLSNCHQTMQTNEGILGGVGCILPAEGYYGHQRVGWSAPNEQVTEVDLVGHAWFFKRDWLQYLWREKPQTWDNGEDIQFSYLAQKYGGIKTFVPPHPKDKPEMFSSQKGMEYGVDDVATSNQRNHKVFYEERNECVNNAVANGWKLIGIKNDT